MNAHHIVKDMEAQTKPLVRAAGVNKVFGAQPGGVVALKDIDLEIRPANSSAFGPFGLREIDPAQRHSRLLAADIRHLEVSGKPVTAPGPDRGMVFQEYALFPWMTVEANIAFGLDIRGTGKEEKARIVDDLLDMLGLKEFRHRFPKDLSGGMRQRVAIARVLALDPPIMLMDEPFGALDALTRRSLQDELLRIWRSVGKTIVFVTHSIEEAVYLGSRVVILTYRPGTIKRDVHHRSSLSARQQLARVQRHQEGPGEPRPCRA